MERKEYIEICDYLKKITDGTKWENHIFSVGGAVRDYVMGNQIKDIDLVFDLKNGGIEFSQWLYENDLLIQPPVTYPTYGTSMFILKEYPNIDLEAVHTRREQYKDPNSRNPEQEYGTIEEDAFRRDCTINALYYNISYKIIMDPTGHGYNDIKENRLIRSTNDNPDIVYQDDALRILRAIRFATRFNFQIEEKTYQSMIHNVDRLSIITKERVADELNKMLMCNHPSEAIRMIYAIGAMKYVIPELEDAYTMLQNKYHKGSVFFHTMMVLDFLSRHDSNNKKLSIRMAALLHDIGKIKTRSVDENGNVHFFKHELESSRLCRIILKRLKYSNDFIDEVAFLCENHMRTKNWGNKKLTVKDKSLRKLQYVCKDASRFYDLIQLIDADNNSHAEGYCLEDNAPNVLIKTTQMVREHTDMFNYKLPIDGNDVMEAKGIKPGREVKEVLDYVLKLCYNNPLISKEDCLKHVRGYKLINK